MKLDFTTLALATHGSSDGAMRAANSDGTKRIFPMSKKKFPSSKFRVRVGHPLKSVIWVGWRADEETARLAARWAFIAKLGYAPTFVGAAMPYRDEPRRPVSPLLAAVMLGTAMAEGMWNPTGRPSLFRV